MQSAQQLSASPILAGIGQGSVEGKAYEEGVQEDVATSPTSEGSENSTRHHHQRASSASSFFDDKERQRQRARRPTPLSLTPLPTIETIMSTSPPQPSMEERPTAHPQLAKPPPLLQHMAYSTVIHIPKPPPLRRRNHLDADTLEEMLRAADRARAKPYVDVDMEDCDAESQSQDTDDMSFRTSASSFPSSSASSYPSPPSSPSPAPLYFPPPPKQSEVPILDLDEMDWDWGDAYDGNVIYGAAGVALSPRVMKERKREANVCCRCRYSMDEEDNGLFVIDEESEEESEEEGAFRV